MYKPLLNFSAIFYMRNSHLFDNKAVRPHSVANMSQKKENSLCPIHAPQITDMSISKTPVSAASPVPPDFLSSKHGSLLAWWDRVANAVLAGEERVVAQVSTPSDTVEFEDGGQELTVAVDLEQVEASDLLLAGADAREDPLPQDVLAGGDDVQRVDARHGRAREVVVDVEGLAGHGGCTQLF
jgi:hypothetical protein